MPAASAIFASLRLSGQLPDQRSGISVTARPDEQFAPNSPILSLFELCIDMRSWRESSGASTKPPGIRSIAQGGQRAGTLTHSRPVLNGAWPLGKMPCDHKTPVAAQRAFREQLACVLFSC